MALHAYAYGGTERLYKWVALNAYESGGSECDSTHGSLALKAYQQNLYLEYYY